MCMFEFVCLCGCVGHCPLGGGMLTYIRQPVMPCVLLLGIYFYFEMLLSSWKFGITEVKWFK